MQMFRPSNESYEQSYNYQSSIKPFAKPVAYGGNNMAQCQTQTQCFETQLPGGLGGGYGMQHADVAQGYGYGGSPIAQKPYGGGHGSAHQGSFGSMQQHEGGGNGLAHQGSFGSIQQHGGGGHGLAHQGSFGSIQQHGGGGHGLAHQGSFGSIQQHGSYGSVCKPQSGGYSYTMKRKERRSWKKRSGNDSDCSGSDESDDEKC